MAPRAAATHSFTVPHRLLDGFEDGFVNPFFWRSAISGATTVAEAGGKLTIEIPSGSGARSGALESTCEVVQRAPQVDWVVGYDLAEWPAGTGARVSLGVGSVFSVARVRGTVQDTLVITSEGVVVTTQTLSATASTKGCLALRLSFRAATWGHALGTTTCTPTTSVLRTVSGSVRLEASVPGATSAPVKVLFDGFSQAGAALQVPCGGCATGEVALPVSYRAPEDPRTCGSSWHLASEGGSTVTTSLGSDQPGGATLTVSAGESVVHGRHDSLEGSGSYGLLAVVAQTNPAAAATCELAPYSSQVVDDGERLVTLRLRGRSPCTGTSGLSLVLVASPTASPGSALAVVQHVPASGQVTDPAVHAVWVDRGGLVRLFSGESLETRVSVPYTSFVAAGEAALPPGVGPNGVAFGARNATASWQVLTTHACQEAAPGGPLGGACEAESLPAEPPGFTGDVYFNAFTDGGEVLRMPLALGAIVGPTECVARVPEGDNIVFLPDGRLAVGGSGTGNVYVVDPSAPNCAVVTTTQLNATPIPYVAGTTGAHFLAVSPDGTRLYTTNQQNQNLPSLYAIDLASGAVTTLLAPTTPGIKRLSRVSGIVFPSSDLSRLLVADGRPAGDFGGLFEFTLSTTLATILQAPAIGVGVDITTPTVMYTDVGVRGLTFDPYTGNAFSCGFSWVLEWNPLGPGVRTPLCVMESGGVYCDGMRSDGRGHLFMAHDNGQLTVLDIWKPCGCRSPELLFQGVDLDGVELIAEEAGELCPGEVGP